MVRPFRADHNIKPYTDVMSYINNIYIYILYDGFSTAKSTSYIIIIIIRRTRSRFWTVKTDASENRIGRVFTSDRTSVGRIRFTHRPPDIDGQQTIRIYIYNVYDVLPLKGPAERGRLL